MDGTSTNEANNNTNDDSDRLVKSAVISPHLENMKYEKNEESMGMHVRMIQFFPFHQTVYRLRIPILIIMISWSLQIGSPGKLPIGMKN